MDFIAFRGTPNDIDPSIGLKLNYSKMKCYIKESKKSEIYHQLREAANIPEGVTEGEDGATLFGLRAYGVPIGSEVFVTEWLNTKGERITSNMLEIEKVPNPTRIANRHTPRASASGCLF